MKTTACYKCHQSIWFGESEKGKKVPMCAWTAEKGKVIAIDPEADVPMLHWIKKTDDPLPEGTPRYHAHLGPMCRPPRRGA